MVPVGNKFVLEAILVSEKGSPQIEALLGGVVEAKLFF